MKKLFPLIYIFLITSISFLGVDTIYKIVEAQLDIADWPKPLNSEKSINPMEAEAPPASHYSIIAERDIFQTRKSNRVVNVDKIVVEDIKPTERNLKLWGTIVGNGPASEYAIIEESGAGSQRNRQFLHKPGDIVQGATITKILREKVILSVEGKNEILHLVERKSAGRFRRTPQTYNQDRNQPIRQKRLLRSSQIQKAIADINKLQSQARIVSNSEGFQISSIRPSSIFRRMGLRNGDIITAVDGRPITSVNDAFEILQHLTTGGKTSLEMKRRGRMRIIDYHIR